MHWIKQITDIVNIGLGCVILLLGSRILSTIRLSLQQNSVRLFVGAAALFTAHEVLSLIGADDDFTHCIQDLLETGVFVCLYFAMMSIAGSQKSEISRLHRLADTDRLTNLENLAAFKHLARQRLAYEREKDCPTAILMIDVDKFKQYNDDFGHEAGNLALQSVADTLRATARESDLVARYGGEEFVSLLSVGSKAAHSAAERFRLAVELQCTPPQNPALHRSITISIGIAVSASSVESLEELMKSADLELYQAKSQGRNRISAGQSVPTSSHGPPR